MEETPRQRFLRNHQENIGVMRAALDRAENDGTHPGDVFVIRQIVEAWEGIGRQAEREELDT
jgi:hypothetical protein